MEHRVYIAPKSYKNQGTLEGGSLEVEKKELFSDDV